MNCNAMVFNVFKIGILLFLFNSCFAQSSSSAQIITGAENTALYLPLLKGKKVGVVANMTSTIGKNHLVDSLLKTGINIKIVFSPEHGFRGDKEYGENVKHTKDKKTGIPIFSLHGKNKKPTPKSLQGLQVVIFDIQDVGVRFYTYISSLHYVMEACAEAGIPLIVLDRPNPNAFYIGGPVLQEKYKSFIGKHPVPVVYGMTIGEYAKMINGENWLSKKIQCKLTVIPLQNWNHQSVYELPIPPSPNLPNQLSIYLYPHLCFFEGTEVSLGRGTEFPFQMYGHPNYTKNNFSFTPISIPGKSSNPPQLNNKCYGKDLTQYSKEDLLKIKTIQLDWLVDAYEKTKLDTFFLSNGFFNLLAGNNLLMEQIKNKVSIDKIQESWQTDLNNFKAIRQKYLIYP